MTNYNAPCYEAYIEGIRWEDSAENGFIEQIEIEDEEAAFITLRLTVGGLSIDQMGSDRFRNGIHVAIKLGYPESLHDWGTFKVSRPQYTFGANKSCSVRLEGQGAGSGSVMAAFEVNEKFVNQSVREIVENICTRYGFKADFGQITTDKTFGSDPMLDVKIPVVLTAGKTHWGFMQGLAQVMGRYAHGEDHVLYFWDLQDKPATNDDFDPNAAELSMQPNPFSTGTGSASGGTGASARVTVKDPSTGQTLPYDEAVDNVAAELQAEGLSASAARVQAIHQIRDTMDVSGDPFVDGRSALTFLWNDTSLDPAIFNIWDVNIEENYAQGAGKAEGSAVNEDSKETETEQAEPDERLHEIDEIGMIDRSGPAAIDGSTAMGFYRGAEGNMLAVGSSLRSEPETYESIVGRAGADSTPYYPITADATDRPAVQAANQATAQAAAANAGSNGDDSGYMSAAEQAGFTEAETVDPATFYSAGGEQDATGPGLFEDLGESLKKVLQGSVDAGQYGVFVSFQTWGVPGVKSRRTIYLSNLSRWSGKTYIRNIRHIFSTQNGYTMEVNARAPGTFAAAPADVGAADANANPEDLQGQQKPELWFEMQLTDKPVNFKSENPAGSAQWDEFTVAVEDRQYPEGTP